MDILLGKRILVGFFNRPVIALTLLSYFIQPQDSVSSF